MAEVICRRLLAEKLSVPADDLEKQGYGVQSAGVMGFGGARASQGAVNAMRGRGIDLSGHRSQAVTPELIYSSDRVYAMSREHLEAVVRIAPSAAGKAYLLDADRDIDDPVGADDGVYQECAGRIEAALRRRLEEIPL
jgi:protein-tyrosine-phosphatase